MRKEFKCCWPTGTEKLRVEPGFTDCAGKSSVVVKVSSGAAVQSVHLHADDAIELAQALAVERAKLSGLDRVTRSDHRCTFFTELDVSAMINPVDSDIALRVGKGLAYLSKADAKALAMDLLAMTANDD